MAWIGGCFIILIDKSILKYVMVSSWQSYSYLADETITPV